MADDPKPSLSDRLKGDWATMPRIDKALLLVLGGALLLAVLMFIPYVEFDPPGTMLHGFPDDGTLLAFGRLEDIYPAGESIAVFETMTGWLDTLTPIMLVLAVWMAFRFRSTRMPWPYRFMWLGTVLCAFEALTTLLALYPGLSGHALWLETVANPYNALALMDINNPAVQRSLDMWDQVTDVRVSVLAGMAAGSGMMLAGAWHARSIRKADKAALAEHERKIIESRHE